jgi:hypothetical protein
LNWFSEAASTRNGGIQHLKNPRGEMVSLAGRWIRSVRMPLERDMDEIERAIPTFAEAPNGGLIVTASALSVVRRDLVIALAARDKLPAVYQEGFYVTAGGLITSADSWLC